MRPLISALALIVATSALGNAFSGTKKKDESPKSLEGTWKCTGIEYDGLVTDNPMDDIVKNTQIKLTGNRGTFTFKGKKVTIRIKTDFTKKPAEIDMVSEDGPAKGQILPGLFVLKNDQLAIMFGYPGLARPGWMESGKGLLFMALKRIE